MVDSAYITENCVLVGDPHRETSSIAAEATRSTLAKPLKVLLPKDATDSPSQQTVNLVNLSQQLLQVAANQADDSQVLANMAACIGKAFNADGCAIVLCDETTAKVRATGWFADAPPLPLQPLEIASDYFGNWLSETARMPCSGMETVRSHPATASSVSKACKVWQSIKQLRTALPSVRAIASAAIHLQDHVHGVISLMRSRTHTWNQSEIAGLQTVSHQVTSTFDQLQLQQQLHKQMQYQRVVNQLTLAIHNSSDLSSILKLATDDTASALQVKRGVLLRLKHCDTLFRNYAQVDRPKVRVNVAYEWLSDTPSEMTYPLQASTAASPSVLPTVSNQSFWLSECALCQQAFSRPSSPFILSSDPAFQPDAVKFSAEGEAAVAFDLKSLPALLLMPLESQGTILGFLVFQHDQPRIWQPAE